jgi:hypothetical protein
LDLVRLSYKTRIQKEYSCLALLGLVGEDKLRPYEFNHDWGNSRRADLVSAQVREGE